MLGRWFVAGIVTGLGVCRAASAQAMPVTFDFDTGTPALSHGTGVPPKQTTDGRPRTSARLPLPPSRSRMQARPSSPCRSSPATTCTRTARTGAPWTSASASSSPASALTFATVDNQDNTEEPGNILLTAYSTRSRLCRWDRPQPTASSRPIRFPWAPWRSVRARRSTWSKSSSPSRPRAPRVPNGQHRGYACGRRPRPDP